ncbi:MAG: N-acetylmuramoyl-L-alanine amidase [Bdellovibrionaceae bacterium]|nr:N-acetylmuramoyl-L-alanine amidase [Pseudobdellovibrionaceae bacterium]
MKTSVNAYTIIIDPGHGGNDKGAVYGPAQESHIVFDISKALKKLLEENHYTVTMTRQKDQFVSLQKRVEVSQNQSADLFVSLHANASEDKRARGIEFFLQAPQNSNSFVHKVSKTDSMLFNNSIENEQASLSKKEDIKKIVSELAQNIKIKRSLLLSSQLKKELPGVIKQAPFYVLTKTEVPSVLIEVGFLSHPKENKKLLTKTYQSEVAQKIFSSLQRFSAKSEFQGNSLDEKAEIPR